jgi:hypothetical protein
MHVVQAYELLGKLENFSLRLAQDRLRFLFLFKALRNSRLRALDELTQDILIMHNADIRRDIELLRKTIHEGGQVIRAARLFQQSALVEIIAQGYQVNNGVLLCSANPLHGLKNSSMRGVVEALGAKALERQLALAVSEQDGAEHRALRFDGMRHRAGYGFHGHGLASC